MSSTTAQTRYRTLVSHLAKVYAADESARTTALHEGLDEIVAKIQPTGAGAWQQVRADTQRLLKVWMARETRPGEAELASQILDALEEYAVDAVVSAAAVTVTPPTRDLPVLLVEEAPKPPVAVVEMPKPAPVVTKVAEAPKPPVAVVEMPKPAPVVTKVMEAPKPVPEPIAAKPAVVESKPTKPSPAPVAVVAIKSSPAPVVRTHATPATPEPEAEEGEADEVEEEDAATEEEEVVEPEEEEAVEETATEEDEGEEEEAAEEEEEPEGVLKKVFRGRTYWMGEVSGTLYTYHGDEEDVGEEVGKVVDGRAVFLTATR